MAQPTVTVVVPLADDGAPLPRPRIASMTVSELKEIRKGHRVTTNYSLVGDREYTPVYWNSLPIKALRAAIPGLDLTIKKMGIPETTIRDIVLPTNDYQSLRFILENLDNTLETAWRRPIPKVNFMPLSIYNSIAEAAHALGMTNVEEDMKKRMQRMLYPDLHKTYLYISEEELDVVCLHHDGNSSLRTAVVSAIARATMVDRLSNRDMVFAMQNRHKQFKQEVLLALDPWAKLMNEGKDVKVAGITIKDVKGE